ncbi:MAG: hypothetical protein Q8939_12810 [Bacteroidota bacterium]|nr:hypothetical protein [Bacteroidota bacterium]
MKTVRIIALILFLGIMAFVVGVGIWFYNASQEGRNKNFQDQLGTYILDTRKTVLGGYSKDSDVYKNLRIVFRADSTFSMNMKVPFIYDSVGRWNAGNMKEWNYLWFKKWGYKDYKEGKGNQFTRPYIADSNVYFLINGTTPQDSAAYIQEIYFRKIKE